MSSWLQSLIILLEISSGPQAFLLFSLPISLFILFWSTGVKNMLDWFDLIKYFLWLLFADIPPDSLFPMVAKYWFKMFATSEFPVIGLLVIINFSINCFLFLFLGFIMGPNMLDSFLRDVFVSLRTSSKYICSAVVQTFCRILYIFCALIFFLQLALLPKPYII